METGKVCVPLNELSLLRLAAKEWRDKYEKAEARIVAVRDDVIEEIRSHLKPHLAQHPTGSFEQCVLCHLDEELAGMKRGSTGNYVPVKMRARVMANALMGGSMLDEQYDGYRKGVKDMLSLVEKMLGDSE
jgi:hypothetical protein